MSIIFMFVDGIGIAPPGEMNPFSGLTRGMRGIEELANGEQLTTEMKPVSEPNRVLLPVDANLGIEGLPQSGTGQTALFTGINAAKEIGKHFGPFPHSGIKPFLKRDSFFHRLKEAGRKPVFMNAYPPVFFERAAKTRRWSCSTLMVKSSGQTLYSTEDVLESRAVTAEFFGDYWRKHLGIELPKRNGEDIAGILLQEADKHDVVFIEYYLTDKAGHAQDLDFAKDVLRRLDEVLQHLLQSLGEHTFVLSSDHGNLEDLSTKSHTRNPVPLIAIGPDAHHFSQIKSIMDVPGGIIEAVQNSES